MRRTRKLVIWIVSGIILLFIILFIVSSVFINHYKPKFEKILTENIGLETKIDGNISLKITPGLSFIANEIKVISNETYVFKIEKAEIAIDYLKLFKSKFDISGLRLTKPQFYILRDSTGKFNYESANRAETLPEKKSDLHELNISVLDITNGRLLYVDLQSGDTLMLDGINLKSKKIGISGNLNKIAVDNIMFDGKVKLDLFKFNMLRLKNLEFKIDGRGGKMAILPVDNDFFGGKSTGKAIFDFTQYPIQIEIQNQVTGIDIGLFGDSVLKRHIFNGKVNSKLDIVFHSFNWKKAKNSLNGSIILSGDNLIMRGINLNDVLKNYDKNRNFDVLDLTALYFAGPYWATLVKDINHSVFQDLNSEDSISVKKLVSNWQIVNGNANSQDVALSTNKYRLCMTGSLNLKSNSYGDTYISLINKDGCAAISQKIDGPFSTPETESQSVSRIVSGSIENLWRNLTKSSGSYCTPVYSGSVEPPL